MEGTAIGGEDLKDLIVLIAAIAFAMTGVILHSRNEWKLLRHTLFRKPGGLAKMERPGRVAGHLDPGRWDAVFRETMERARADLERDDEGAAKEGLDVLKAAEAEVAPLVREVALRAMTTGELQSIVIGLDGVTVYALAFPGRHEDRRSFRRHQSLSEGWPAHAAAVRRASAGASAAPPLIGLLYFLGLDARDGALLLAYEGDEGHLFPAELAEVTGGSVPARTGPSWTYEFAPG
jgi:hypothetical protein